MASAIVASARRTGGASTPEDYVLGRRSAGGRGPPADPPAARPVARRDAAGGAGEELVEVAPGGFVPGLGIGLRGGLAHTPGLASRADPLELGDALEDRAVQLRQVLGERRTGLGGIRGGRGR